MQFVFVRAISVALFFGFAGTVSMADEKPEAILATAKKLSENQPWRVEAHVVAKDIDMNISGIINGQDFDLTIDSDDQVRRQIVIGDKGWLTEKDGKTWKSWDANDRRFYYLVHTPIADTGQKFRLSKRSGSKKKEKIRCCTSALRRRRKSITKAIGRIGGFC